MSDAGYATQYLAAITLEVGDLAMTRRNFESNDVSFELTEAGTLRVPSEFACGVVLEFAD